MSVLAKLLEDLLLEGLVRAAGWLEGAFVARAGAAVPAHVHEGLRRAGVQVPRLAGLRVGCRRARPRPGPR